MTKPETARVVAVIRATIPNAPAVGVDTTAAWHDILGDLPFEAVLKATRAVLSTQEIPAWPAVGKIRRAAVDLMRPAVPSAAEAWAEVEAEIRRQGWYNRPERLTPLAARVVKAIGWKRICESEEPGVERGQFLRMYDQFAQSEEREAVLPEALRPGSMAPALPGEVAGGLKAIGAGGHVVPMGRERA